MLRFMDNIAVIAETKEELGNVLTKINYRWWHEKKTQNTNIQKAGTEFEHNNWTCEVGYSSIFTYFGSKIIYNEKIKNIKSRKVQEKQ